MSALYHSIIGPALRLLDPETAHGLALQSLKVGFGKIMGSPPDPFLKTTLWGLDFASPVGLAAGFDKNGAVPEAVLDLGFGFTEIGSVTPKPQPGNPKPRLFRLTEDQAVINRMGFNSEGMEAAGRNLAHREDQSRRQGIVGINLGKNKTSDDAIADYVKGVSRLAPLADYIVVNVSSPNTPGLRALQGKEPLIELLQAVQDALNMRVPRGTPPLLLKIAPDLTDEDKSDIASVVLDIGIDGLIVTNTTIERPGSLRSAHKGETGGLSGQPLFEPSTAVLRDLYQLTGGRVPIIGVGGISSGAQAYAKICAGASLVQIYSAMVYHGPGLASRINRELAALLRRDGFSSVAEAVGTAK